MVVAALTVVVVVAAAAAFDAAAAPVDDAAAVVEESTGWAFVVVTVHKCLLTNFLLIGFEFRASELWAVRNSLELLKIVERLGVESFVAEQMPTIGWHP